MPINSKKLLADVTRELLWLPFGLKAKSKFTPKTKWTPSNGQPLSDATGGRAAFYPERRLSQSNGSTSARNATETVTPSSPSDVSSDRSRDGSGVAVVAGSGALLEQNPFQAINSSRNRNNGRAITVNSGEESDRVGCCTQSTSAGHKTPGVAISGNDEEGTVDGCQLSARRSLSWPTSLSSATYVFSEDPIESQVAPNLRVGDEYKVRDSENRVESGLHSDELLQIDYNVNSTLTNAGDGCGCDEGRADTSPLTSSPSSCTPPLAHSSSSSSSCTWFAINNIGVLSKHACDEPYSQLRPSFCASSDSLPSDELTDKANASLSLVAPEADQQSPLSVTLLSRRRLGQDRSMDSIPLHDYFYTEQCDTLSAPSHPKSSQGANPRVGERRLKYNAVIDRLKKLTRPQSQSRALAGQSALKKDQSALKTKDSFKVGVKRCHSIVNRNAETVENCPEENAFSLAFCGNNGVGTQEDGEFPSVRLRRFASDESLPSDSGCGSSIKTSSLSTDSNRSSICTPDEVNSVTGVLFRGPFIGQAKAIVDCTPCPYDRDALAFKKGEVVNIIAKNDSGTWIGMSAGKIGHFKFINVEEVGCERSSLMKNGALRATTGPTGLGATCPLNATGLAQQRICFEEKESENRFSKLRAALVESKGEISVERIVDLVGLRGQGLEAALDGRGISTARSFSEVEHHLSPGELGTSNQLHQELLLGASREVRLFLQEIENDFLNQEEGRRKDNGLHFIRKASKKHHPFIAQSAPVTPAVDVSCDDFSNWFKQLTLAPSTLYDELESINLTHAKNSPDRAGTGGGGGGGVTEKDKTSNKLIQATNEAANGPETEEIYAKVSKSQQKRNNYKRAQSADAVKRIASRRFSSFEPMYANLPSDALNEERATYPPSPPEKKHLDANFLIRNIEHTFNPVKAKLTESKSNKLNASRSVFDLRFSEGSGEINTKKRVKKLLQSERKFGANSGHNANGEGNIKSGSSSQLDLRSKPIPVSLLEAIGNQLKKERIDLTSEPHSDPTGFCGIPPGLVQRYSEETSRDMYEVADALDHIRLAALVLKGRRGVPNDFLADACVGPVSEQAQYQCLSSWLTSLGLPMYEELLKNNGRLDLRAVAMMRETDIIVSGITNKRHVRALVTAIGALNVNIHKIGRM